MISAPSFAQKQSGGEKNFQVLFAPLGGNPVSIGGISYRKFNGAGDAAWRVNLFIGLNSKTEVTGQPVDTGSFATGGAVPEADKKTSGMTISIRPGYEKHFAGTDRLSPYVGAEILFSMTTSKVTQDTVMVNTVAVAPTSYQVMTTTKKGDGASTSFGVNLLAGFDYYIAKGLSLGAEFGFGFSTTSMPNITSERAQYNKTSGTPEVVANRDKIQGSSMQVGPNVVGQLKLGWLFN